MLAYEKGPQQEDPGSCLELYFYTLDLFCRRPQYTPRYSMEFEDQEPTPKKEPLNCIDNNSKVSRDFYVDDTSLENFQRISK